MLSVSPMSRFPAVAAGQRRRGTAEGEAEGREGKPSNRRAGFLVQGWDNDRLRAFRAALESAYCIMRKSHAGEKIF